MRIGMMAAVVGLVASTGLGGAAESGANAALKYYRAWLLVDTALADVLVTGEDIGLVEGGSAQLEAAGGSVLALLDAAEDGAADWDIAYEDGPEAEIPHLGKMRSSAKILAADALRCAEAGDIAGAAERNAALYRMAKQLAPDRTLISSLVGMAIADLGNSLTEELNDQGAIDGDGAQEILAAMHDLGDGDRFWIRESIVWEWSVMSQYVVRNADRENAGAWLIERMQAADDSEPGRAVAAMSRSELLQSLGGFAEYYADLLRAWDTGDVEKMYALESKVEQGRYGMLTRLMGATMSRAFSSHLRFDGEFKQAMSRLEEIDD